MNIIGDKRSIIRVIATSGEWNSTPMLNAWAASKKSGIGGREFSSVEISFNLFSYFQARSQIRGVFISEISIQFNLVEIDYPSSVLQKFLKTH